MPSLGKHLSSAQPLCVTFKENGEGLIRGSSCLPFASALVHTWFFVGSMLLIFLVFCFVLSFCALFVFVECLVYPILPVSLDWPFLIAPSVFSNVYLIRIKSCFWTQKYVSPGDLSPFNNIAPITFVKAISTVVRNVPMKLKIKLWFKI